MIPFPPPLRLRILQNLTKTLEQTVYQYDPNVPPQTLEGAVFRGRVIYGDDDPEVLLSILEAPIPVEQVGSAPDSTASTGDWELLLQGFVQDDFENPTDPAHYLMAAAKVRLAYEKARNRDFDILGLGNHVTDLRFGAGVVRPPDEISSKAYFWLNITLEIVEDLSKPYEINL